MAFFWSLHPWSVLPYKDFGPYRVALTVSSGSTVNGAQDVALVLPRYQEKGQLGLCAYILQLSHCPMVLECWRKWNQKSRSLPKKTWSPRLRAWFLGGWLTFYFFNPAWIIVNYVAVPSELELNKCVEAAHIYCLSMVLSLQKWKPRAKINKKE